MEHRDSRPGRPVSKGRPAVAPRYTTVMRPDVLDWMRRRFRQMNVGMVLLWRLGLGPLFGAWPAVGGRVMVLVHTGRKSGRRFRTPLNYAPIGDAVYCIAGFGPATDWYRNILDQPQVELWLPEGRWEGLAEDLSDSPQRTHLMRRVMIDSGLAAPAFGLHPRRMTDADVREATATYRLVRITRTGRRHGAGGPGDLAWVWLVVAVLWFAGLRRSRRSRSTTD